MRATPNFPNDDNGQVLQRMLEAGDDLSKARDIDFCFVFPDRTQAVAFIQHVPDKSVEMSLSWLEATSMWEVIVKLNMVPSHAWITAMELALTSKAEKAGGSADGWGCLQVPRLKS